MKKKELYGHYIKIISTSLEKNRDSDMKKQGITVQQMKFLFSIMSNNHPVNQHDLEVSFGLKNSTVSGILMRLEKKGLISRKVSQEDSRKKYIEVTDKALNIKTNMCEQIDKMEALITKDFSVQEKELLMDFLKRVTANLLIYDQERMK